MYCLCRKNSTFVPERQKTRFYAAQYSPLKTISEDYEKVCLRPLWLRL